MQRFGHLRPSFLPTFLLLALIWWRVPLFSQANLNDPMAWQVRADLGDAEIRTFVQDRLGFLWIATTKGLYRFDGAQAQVFLHNADDSLSISDDYILDLAYDPVEEAVWLVTKIGGIDCLDSRTGRCRRYVRVADSVVIDRPDWILVDRRQHVWASCSRGLIEIEPVTRAARLRPFPPEPPGQDRALWKRRRGMMAAVEDRRNDALLWIGTTAGLLEFNKTTHAYRWHAYAGAAERQTQANTIRCLYQDTDGALYCGTYHFGLLRFDPATGVFTPVALPTGVTDRDLWENVSQIIPCTPESLWVTTVGGLAVLHTPTQRLTIVARNSLLNKIYFGIRYLDNAGRSWNWVNGELLLFDPLRNPFRYYPCPDAINPRDFIVRKIEPDTASGKLYIAAQLSNGLYTLDRHSGQWNVLRPAGAPAIGTFQGWDLLHTRQGEWLVLENGGLYRYAKDRALLEPYRYQPPMHEAYYRTLEEDGHGDLWIGSYYKGVARMNPQTGATRIYKSELEGPGMPGASAASWHILKDHLDQMWIRHERGYSVYQPERDSFCHLFPFGKRQDTHVERFELDSAGGRMWIVGAENGLGIADPSKPEQEIFKHLTYGQPLRTQRCIGLVTDRKRRVWIGSSAGLECLAPDLQSSFLVSSAYGIRAPVIYMTTLPSGEIALGHRGAISIFNPDSVVRNTEKPIPYLTSFKVFQVEYESDTLLSHRHTIALAHNQNYFSIEFSAVGYILPEEYQFEYRLEGVDRSWVNPGARRYVSYTNLGSGDYIFSLRVANNEGVWCERPLRLRIHIATPWWRTVWAWVLYILLAAGGLYRLYRFQLRRRLEHAEALQLKEMDAVKTRLYTNITHEFRTPLTVISGMADQIKEDPGRWLVEGPDIIRRNSQNLLGLVNQMLELRKLEAGMLPVHLILGDIVAYIKYLTESFHSYAESKKIKMTVLSHWEHFEMDFDPDKILTIVANLLSNAIKFTPAGGTITLMIGAHAEKNGSEFIEIAVHDTGIGIPTEELPFIFDRFHQVNAASISAIGGGTGIGLALTRELTQLLGGNIQAESTYGQGAVFTVTLPVGRQAPPASDWPVVQEKARLLLNLPTPHQLEPDTQPGYKPLIQIVEDNADVVRYLLACLQSEYRVSVAPDGKAGVQQVFSEIPDLVVSDVMMPEMDGFEMCHKIKTDERSSHIPVILLTARADMESRLQGLQHGADIYLAKPFDKTELLLQIRNLLNTRRAMQAHYLALATQQQPAPTGEAVQEEDAFVLKVRAIVESHINDPAFDVAQFCRAVGMSNSNLHRKLTALTGRSANQFIRHIRLANACVLLRDPESTIAAVAYDCGFSDPVYFARVFRQEFGLTPSEWRAGQTH